MGCIYVACNRVNGKQYVGQTMRALGDRKAEHFRKRHCRAIANDIKKYGLDSFEWKILHDGILLKSELDRLEIQEITRLRTHAPNGYNLTAGGDGFDWDDPAFRERHRVAVGEACRTPTHRANLSAAITRFYADPENRKRMDAVVAKRKANPVWQRNLREGIKRRNAREDWKEKNAEARRKRNASKSWWLNHAAAMVKYFAKPVACIETGKVYESAREVWRQTGISAGSISQHLRGRSKSAGGFHWRYAA